MIAIALSPIVTSPTRSAPAFRVTLMVIVRPPVPRTGSEVSHSTELRVCQSHSSCVDRLTAIRSPAASASAVVRLSVNTHGASRCITVQRASLMTMVAVRERGRVFCATASVSVASPCPEFGSTVIHGSVADAVQRQSRVIRTVALLCTPVAFTTSGTPDTDCWQRALLLVLGPVSC